MLSDPVVYTDLLPDSKPEEVLQVLSRLYEIASSVVSKIRTNGATVSYSGGIDSSILAQLLRERSDGNQINFLTLGLKDSYDTRRKVPSSRFLVREVDPSTVELAAVEVSKMVRVSTVAQFDDCVCFWLIANELKLIGNSEVLIDANGPDELFCGYDRFRRILDGKGYQFVDVEIARALGIAKYLKKEVKLILSKFGLDSITPFLEGHFVEFSLSKVPVSMKILRGDDRLRKRIWRALGRKIGVPDLVVAQPKKAMQYSMGVHPVIMAMIKKGRINLESLSGRPLSPNNSMQF
jgi:asparagine synthase (glutamine-hydrolysing)